MEEAFLGSTGGTRRLPVTDLGVAPSTVCPMLLSCVPLVLLALSSAQGRMLTHSLMKQKPQQLVCQGAVIKPCGQATQGTQGFRVQCPPRDYSVSAVSSKDSSEINDVLPEDNGKSHGLTALKADLEMGPFGRRTQLQFSFSPCDFWVSGSQTRGSSFGDAVLVPAYELPFAFCHGITEKQVQKGCPEPTTASPVSHSRSISTKFVVI